MKLEATGSQQLQQLERVKSEQLQKLATGKRVNSAADDAAALQIIDRLQAQQNGQYQAIRNAYDGISYTQIAESAYSGISESVQRIETLSLQAGNGALGDTERSVLQNEIIELQQGIQDTLSNTTFAGQNLFSGEEVHFQIGADAEQTQSVTSNDGSFLNAVLAIDVSTKAGAQAALDVTKQARDEIDINRTALGASQNALAAGVRNLTQQNVATAASQSRIQDADYAQLIAQKTSNDILSQASIALRGQANQQASSVLSLL